MVDEARRLGAYVETTVSGTGLRIIGTAANGADYNTKLRLDGGGSIELYRRATRYITISGLQHGKCRKLPNIDALLDGTYKRFNGISKSSHGKFGSNYQPLEDWEIDAALPSRRPMIIRSGFKTAARSAKNTAKTARDRWDKWSATSEKYDKRQCDKKFDECLKVNGYNDGTIAYYANEHGPDWRDKGLRAKIDRPHQAAAA